MKLMDLLKSRLGIGGSKDEDATPAPPPAGTKPTAPVPGNDGGTPAQAPTPAAAGTPPSDSTGDAPPRPAEAPADASGAEVDTMVKEFQAIQELLHSDDDSLIDIPCEAVLRSLPEEYRGPQWTDGEFPQTSIQFDRNEVVEQLFTGKVVFPYQTFSDQLPEGYVEAPEDAVISLDLALVVDALPAEVLNVEAAPSADMQAVANMRDFFQPTTPTAAEPDEQAPAPTPAEPESAAAPPIPDSTVQAQEAAGEPPMPTESETPVVPESTAGEPPPAPRPFVAEPTVPESPPTETEKAVPPPPRPPAAEVPARAAPQAVPSAAPAPPDGWSGREPRVESAPFGIDINDASVEDLAALPGMGPVTARSVIDYRSENGPFSSIYELSRVPRIGPKTFARVTGLSPRSRKRRQEKLNRMLGFELDEVPSIPAIVEGIVESLRARGALIASAEGICFASHGSFPIGDDLAGALAPRLMDRCRSYLKRLTGGDGHCLIVPLEGHSLVLLSSRGTCVVVSYRQKTPPARAMPRAISIAAEVSWLMSPRAVVRDD